MLYFSMMCLEARMIGSRSVEISAEVEKVRCRCLAAGETFLNVGSYIGNQSAIVSNKGTPCSAWNPAYYQRFSNTNAQLLLRLHGKQQHNTLVQERSSDMNLFFHTHSLRGVTFFLAYKLTKLGTDTLF